MSNEQAKPEPTPVKPKDLDFEQLAMDLTPVQEKTGKRAAKGQPAESKAVVEGDTGGKDREDEGMSDSEESEGETAPPGTPGADKPSPRGKFAKALVGSDEVASKPIFSATKAPDHAGELRAETERLEAKIRYRLAAYLDQLLARVGELPIIEQAKLAPMMQQMHMNAFDQAITTHWTKKLEKAILEKITLLQNAKGTPRLRGLGAVAAQVAKELRTDGRTVPARMKKAVGRTPAADLPAMDA